MSDSVETAFTLSALLSSSNVILEHCDRPISILWTIISFALYQLTNSTPSQRRRGGLKELPLRLKVLVMS
jgi:hypothetical protein